MRQLIIILSVILVITYKSVRAQDDNGLYSRRYERLDIGTILASPRLVTNYVDCLLNKKPCPPEGKALKRILPEALRTKCEKCWPNQKEGALKVITALYNDYPKQYNALREKWDPTGEYNRRFEEYLRDQSFNTIGSNNNNNNNYLDNDDINQGEQTQEITQRPTRQGTRSTTTVPTIRTTTIQSTTIKQTTMRKTTISPPTKRQTTKRLTTTTTTTSRPSTSIRTTTTELPSSSSEINQPNDILNRFGSEDEIAVTSTTTAPKTTTIRRQPTHSLTNQPQPPVSSNQPQYLPGFVTTTTFQSYNPILNIFNRLTTKLSNTADFVAGVLRVPQNIEVSADLAVLG